MGPQEWKRCLEAADTVDRAEMAESGRWERK